MLKRPLDKYLIKDFYNLNKVGKEPKSKLEVIANGVNIAVKSTLNYLKKYVHSTPEIGDEANPYRNRYQKLGYKVIR